MRRALAVLFLCLASPAAAETCIASHYGVGDGYGGRRTASGERMNAGAMTAAHRSLRFGSVVRVCRDRRGSDTGMMSHHCISVRINDRGPYVRGRCIDLSHAAFRKLCGNRGTCRVTVSRN